jgi:hypothetical protein
MSGAQKWLLHAAAVSVVASGVVYGILKYFGKNLAAMFPGLFPSVDDPFAVVSHPLQPWALDLHVLAAPVLVFALGLIFKDHVLAKLSARGFPVRRSGVVQAVLVLPMVLSGYLLQTVTSEGLHRAMVIAHVGSGSVFALAYAAHVFLAPKRSRNDGAGDARVG